LDIGSDSVQQQVNELFLNVSYIFHTTVSKDIMMDKEADSDIMKIDSSAHFDWELIF
jgi:hypothetical protein